VWRLILAEPPLGSLVDIETKWSFKDLMDANEALDIREEMIQEAHDEALKNQERSRGKW
jgi:hypothetical protein